MRVALAGQPPDRAGANHFFPAQFPVEAVPAALEDLDAALAASAALAPYDFDSGNAEPVRMLVPMSQRVFDPRVLVVEVEDPIFVETVARFVATRQDWRQRRDFVRVQRDGLQTLIAGPPAPIVPILDPGQVEPEPVETVAGLGFDEALLSPTTTSGPWDVRVTFTAAHNILPNATFFVRLRVDVDAMPQRIEVRWRTQVEHSTVFTEPPAPPLERVVNGQPQATPLWLVFGVSSAGLNLVTGAMTGFTLHADSGRLALATAGQLTPGSTAGQMTEEVWWRAGDAPAPEFTGGTWTTIVAEQLLAPFEELHVPVFPDGRDPAARVLDIERAINPIGVTARATAMGVNTHGLERVLAELDAEASEADDFVDTYFTRAQVNLYRIRKLVLGQTAAQKLLINPAIAAIAEQETAAASADQLGTFVTAAKQRSVTAANVNAVLNPVAIGGAVPRFEAREGFSTPENPTIRARVTTFEVADRFTGAARLDVKTDVLRDVLGQRPESGPTLPPRGLSIGQRFVEPPATQNLSYARAALTQLLNQLPRLRLPLVGQTVRSLRGTDVQMVALQGRAVPPPPPNPPPQPPITSETIRNAAVLDLLNAQTVDDDTDEAEVTLAALDFTEVKSAILRTIERVVQERRIVIQTGQETVRLLREQQQRAAGRVVVIDGSLAEARHDVSVARALRQEEQQRVAAINERRDELIRNEVRFLAYVRPRAVDPTRRHTNYWKLEAFDVPATVPACLRRHDEPPPPLSAYVQLFRHAPARWFGGLRPLIAKLTTQEKLLALLDATRGSALSFAALDTLGSVHAASEAVQFTVRGAHQVIASLRQKSSVIQNAAVAGRSWKDLLRDAEQHASVGDLISDRHGSREVSAAATGELELIGRVATCLHAEFAAVMPAIRLEWIERFSQFDRPALLRNLTALPQYGKLDRAMRRRMQELVDWLFGRIDASERDAVNLMNDLVRLCLLLASHAPVGRIIAGHVPRPTLVRPGLQIPIRPLNPELVRVGMEFHVWQASRIVARGRVEDLHAEEVSARVEHVEAQTTTIDTTMRVQFVAAGLSLIR
jgi:hypothetical protein